MKIQKFAYFFILIFLLTFSCKDIMLKNETINSPEIRNNYWLTSDQQKFSYKEWGITPDKAVIIAVHGLSGAADDFAPLGEYLSDKGFVTYAINERGQGNDFNKSSKRGDIENSDLWLRDLFEFSQLIHNKYPDKPVFYYAESLGALITVNLLSQKSENYVRGLILASPVVKLENQTNWWQNLLFRMIFTIHPKYKVNFSDFEDKKHPDKEKQRVTRDDKYQESLAKMPHYLDGFTIRFIKNTLDLMNNMDNAASKINIDTLVLYAGHDIFTKPKYIDSFFEKINTSDKDKILFKDSYHLLLHDYDKDQVLKSVDNWLNQKL